MERHFDTKHYLCHHPTCLTDRFIVFYSDIDLAHHERTVHQVVQNGGSKIQLEFKFHKHGNNNNTNSSHDMNHGSSESRNGPNINYQIDGTAFTPPALPSTASNIHNTNNSAQSSQRGDSVALHPQHAARTEQLRQQAAALRHSGELRGGSSSMNELEHLDEANIASSAFPSLQETVPIGTNHDDSSGKNNPNSINRLTIGWTADGSRAASFQRKPAGVVTEQDFPSLVTNNNNTSKAKALPRIKKAPVSASISNGNNWTVSASGNASQLSRTVTPPIPLAYATMTTPSTPSLKPPPQHQSKQSNVDLSDQQSFPSLGVGNKSTMKKAAPYTAAQDFAASIRKTSPSTGMGLSLLSPLQKSSTTTVSKHAIPDVSSADNFPSLTSSSTKNMNGPGSTHKAKNIVSVSNSNASTTLSIDAMKGILGPVGYKSMKTYTREFVNREMTADSYVDHMASLFPNGYTDVHFWNFVPELIRSFPSTADQDGAFAYMENLHRMKNGALNHEAHYHNSKVSTALASHPPPPAKSSASYATLASTHIPPVQQQITINSYTPTSTRASSKVNNLPKANSSTAWGGATAATSITNPKSASMKTSTNTTPQLTTGSTTQSTTANNTNKKKSGSSKQKNELRALAFGL